MGKFSAESQAERFQRLAWPFVPTLLRGARYLLHRSEGAEDLVQEAMLKAMKGIDGFQDGTDMKAWLMAILRRTHIDHLRAATRRPSQVSLESADEAAIGERAEEDAGRRDELWAKPQELLQQFEDQAVIDALKALPEEIRWTLMLVDVEQMDHAQAAVVLEVPVGTVKSRAHRGRQMLRDRLYELAMQRGWVESDDSPGTPGPSDTPGTPGISGQEQRHA